MDFSFEIVGAVRPNAGTESTVILNNIQ